MAEKSETLVTKDERISEAKELFGRGSRNYCMKQYADAADDLSECCSIYSELYGPNADELGLPYLMYAKSLIALGKDENNLIVAEEADDDEDDDEEEQDEEAGENEGEDNADGEEKEQAAVATTSDAKANENEPMDTVEKADKDGEGEKEAEKKDSESKDKADDKGESAATSSVPGSSEAKQENGEPQPGPSTSNGATSNNAQEEAADNLQVAWEILELAVNIFQQQGEKGYENLPECYMELAGISFENSFFKEATKDYVKALEIYKKTAQPDLRLLAEVNYKVGLCYMMEREFEESIKSFKGAVTELEKVVEQEKAKEQTDDIKETILDLEDMKMEILEKINDVEDAMKTPIEDVKRELAKIIVSGEGESSSNGTDLNNGASSSTAAGSSNGSSTSKPAGVAAKPATDISHLIKRKKPDTVSTEVEGSPAKKTASETENVASHSTSA